MSTIIINPYMTRTPNGLLDNLVAFYEFDEASGVATDAGPNKLHLTDNNSDCTSTTTSKIGRARVAPNSSDPLTYLQNTSSLFNPGSSQYTFSIWFRPSIVDANFRPIIVKRADAGNNRSYLLTYSNSDTRWQTTNDGTAFDTTSASTVFSANTWYFILCGWDGTNQWIRINNGASSTTAITSTFPGTANFRVSNNAGFEVGAGNYDLLGYWKRTLSAADMTFLYNNGNGRSYIDFTSR